MIFMLVAVALLALLRRYDGSDMMPLVAGCSATLAAVMQPGNSTRVDDPQFKEAMEEKCLLWGIAEAVTQGVEDVDSTREEHVTREENLDRESPGNVEPTMAKPTEHATFFDAKTGSLIMGIAYAWLLLRIYIHLAYFRDITSGLRHSSPRYSCLVCIFC